MSSDVGLREQLSIREIARRTGLSYAEKLGAWLKSAASKSRKQRRTLKQMHADLAALGYQGSYNRVAAFARAWHARRHEAQQTTGRGTFVPLAFGPGEAFQLDWS